MRDASDGLSPDRRRARLLVVENELSTIFALRSFFALAGFEVDCAAGTRDGLHLLDRHAYDAVITDLQLTPARASEGFDIAQHARDRNPEACLVMLTAYGSEITERRAQRCGVDLYFTKPVSLPDLQDAIDLVLAERSSCRPH
jgi:DNA-binding response OmpR family regulator